MDGLEVLARLKKIDPNLPVILLTAYASQKSAIDALNLGAFQYLEKGAKNDEIRSWSRTPSRCARCAPRTRT